MLSGNGRHRRPRQAPALVVAAGVTGSAIAIPLLGATGAHAADSTNWDQVAECETGGAWSQNSGNGYYGGLQLSQDAWEQYGGLDYAPSADQASRSQQIRIAEKIHASQGIAAWPTCGLLAGLGNGSGGTGDGSGAAGDGASEGSDASGSRTPPSRPNRPRPPKRPSHPSHPSRPARPRRRSRRPEHPLRPLRPLLRRRRLTPRPTVRAARRATRPTVRANPPSRTLPPNPTPPAVPNRRAPRARPAPASTAAAARTRVRRERAVRTRRRAATPRATVASERPGTGVTSSAPATVSGPSPTPLTSTAGGTRSTPTTRPSSVPTPTTSCPVRRSRSRANRAKSRGSSRHG